MMIGTLKITEKIIRENAFEHKKKKKRVKFNPGLSANRPSNDWAQVFVLRATRNERHNSGKWG